MTTVNLTAENRGYAWSANEHLRYQGRTYHVGFLSADMKGRQEFQGPIVSGPFAWGNLDATVISDHHIPGPVIRNVSDGDRVILGDDTYEVFDISKVERYRNGHNLGLKLIS